MRTARIRMTLMVLVLALSAVGCLGDGTVVGALPVPGATNIPPPDSKPRIAMDGAGNGIAAWNEGLEVWAQVYLDDAGGWQAAEMISTGSATIESVSVAMRAPAIGIVVWEQGENVWSLEYDRVGGWESAPTQVDRAVGRAFPPIVATNTLGPSSVFHAVWREVIGANTLVPFAGGFAARHLPGGGWDLPDRLDTVPPPAAGIGKTIFSLRVAVDGFGRGIAVWDRADADQGNLGHAVFAARWSGTDWDPPERLAFGRNGRTGQPDVALDVDGNAVVVYVHEDRIYSRFRDEAKRSWELPERVDEVDGEAWLPRVEMDGDGSAFVVWSYLDLGGAHARRHDVFQGWSASVGIDVPLVGVMPGGTAADLEIAMDDEFNARAVWAAGNQVWTALFDGRDRTWGFAESLGDGEYPHIGMDRSGRSIAVWWDDGFREQVWDLAVIPRGTGEIAFSSDRDGDAEIYTMFPDGTNLIRRTTHDAVDIEPAFSPDRTQIVFASDRPQEGVPDGFDLFLLEVSTGTITRLTFYSGDGGSIRQPAWSPDGTEIVASSSPPFAGIVVVPVAGNPRWLTNRDGDAWPDWSPDGPNGSRIAFSRDGNLLSVDPTLDSSQTPEVLLSRTDWDDYPAWSPDGTRLAFASTAAGTAGVFTLSIAGGAILQITDFPGDTRPCWSPAGTEILLERRSLISVLTKVHVASGTDDMVAEGVFNSRDPDWR